MITSLDDHLSKSFEVASCAANSDFVADFNSFHCDIARIKSPWPVPRPFNLALLRRNVAILYKNMKVMTHDSSRLQTLSAWLETKKCCSKNGSGLEIFRLSNLNLTLTAKAWRWNHKAYDTSFLIIFLCFEIDKKIKQVAVLSIKYASAGTEHSRWVSKYHKWRIERLPRLRLRNV